MEIEITPLKRQELAEAKPGPHGTQKQRIIPGGVTLSCRKESRDFFPGERVYLPALV